MMRHLRCPALAALCLGSFAPPGFGGAAAATGACSAAAGKVFIGKAASQDLLDHALERAGGEKLRLVEPGKAYTAEMNGNRLSIVVDARGRITAVYCG